jgi:hypothetical protein
VGLGAALADSPQANACFATQWFRFSEGRFEDGSDAATLASLTSTETGDGGNMISMFKALTRSPQFRLRRVKP